MSATVTETSGAIRNVACLGSGTIGGGWAAVFLAGGYDVRIFDPDPGARVKVLAAVDAAWPWLECAGSAVDGVSRDRLVFCDSLEDAVEGADLVQESVPERLDLKIAEFAKVDRHAPPDCIIASSSSRFVPDDLARDCERPGRCIVAHPFAPTYLIPLVELLGSSGTPATVIERAERFYRALGKAPIVLKRPIEGYIANRLQNALVAEARHLVEEGICDFTDIDEAIIQSIGIRWAFMGVSFYYHLGGGTGGIEHALRQFPWKGNDESRDNLLRSVEVQAGGRDIAALESWRDRNVDAVLKARNINPSRDEG